MMLRCLAFLPLFLAPLVAQEGKRRPDIIKQIAPEGGDVVSDTGEQVKGDGDMKGNELVPVQRRAGAMYCQFHVHAKPERLMPGQNGTLVVTAVMKDRAVLNSPAPLQVMSPSQQGVVTVGSPTFHEAQIGRLHKAYQGRPVYENYAMMELPITVGADAVVGTKLTVNLEFEFDLFDGDSAQSIGHFTERAAANVEVGRSLDPAVRGGFTPPIEAVERPAAAPPAVESGREDADADPRAQQRKAIGGVAATGTSAVPPANADTPRAVTAAGGAGDGGPVIAEENGPPWMLIAGGGVLLVAVLLLVLRRK